MDEKKSKSWQDYGREWLDTLVVAISVAMAFRAYFFEPFNIPTGSMQPTLYGNHSESCEEPGLWQTTPLKWLNWLVSGRDYKELVVPFDGALRMAERRDGRVDLYFVNEGGASAPVTLPTDVLGKLRIPVHPAMLTSKKFGFSGITGEFCEITEAVPVSDRMTGRPILDAQGEQLKVPHGQPVRFPHGWKLWQGYDTSGDFIFVNRWRWNFRKPARGEVMVFATTGIDGLEQGTHYIKRMTGLPGETIEIKEPDVVITHADGKREIISPERLKPMTGRRGEATPKPCDMGQPYGRHFELKDREYYACGDNSTNSKDSRYWGAVPERNLKGTGSFVFWPIINPRWGFIK